jgi:membrane protein
MATINLKGFWQVLKMAGAGFIRDKVVKLSASLAYYTVFSLGPMIIVIIFLGSIFFEREAIEGTIYNQIAGFIGSSAAAQVQHIIKNAAISNNNLLSGTIGIITLIIGATGVFSDMQDSINTIWGLDVKPNIGWRSMAKNRLWSFSILISFAFLLLISLIINTLLEGLMGKLYHFFPDLAVMVIYIVNLLITLIVVSCLFAIIFKVLPDAIIGWRNVIAGAVFTAVMFMIGKFGITLYVNVTDLGNTYGASGSLVVLLVWVYYSSLILFFGAEFTKAYAVKFGSEIKPNQYAVTVQLIRLDKGEKSIQQNEKEKRHDNDKQSN